VRKINLRYVYVKIAPEIEGTSSGKGTKRGVRWRLSFRGEYGCGGLS